MITIVILVLCMILVLYLLSIMRIIVIYYKWFIVYNNLSKCVLFQLYQLYSAALKQNDISFYVVHN